MTQVNSSRRVKTLLLVLSAVAILHANLSLRAQAPATGVPPLTKERIYAGYSYWTTSGSVQGHSYNSIVPGFNYGGDFYFNRWRRHLGVEVEGSYHHNKPCANCVYTLQAGPTVQMRKKSFDLTGHVLFGGAHVSGPNIPNAGSSFFFEPGTWGFGMTAGGAVEKPLFGKEHSLAWRIVQVDLQYVKVNFGPVQATTGGSANMPALQVGTGLAWRWR